MAIERKSKVYAFNTPPEEIEKPMGDEPEGSPMDNPMEESEEGEAPEGGTATIPTSLLAGQAVNPGDVVRLEVVSTDPKSGMVTVKYATSGEKGMM